MRLVTFTTGDAEQLVGRVTGDRVEVVDAPRHTHALRARPGCEIEGIGVLRNPVISWQEAYGEPAPPRVRW